MTRGRALLVDITPLRFDRDYRFWWIGQLVSAVGNQATRMALRYQVFVLTGSVLAVGALTVVQFAAVILFALIGGSVADAFDRRRVLLIANTGMGLSSVGLLLVAGMEAPPLPLIFLLAFVSGGLGSVDLAVRGSAIPRLVPRERLAAAFALAQVNGRTGAIVGPALAGVIIATVGIFGVYLLDVTTFLASLVALIAIRPIAPLATAVRPGLSAIRAGLAFTWRRRLIRSVLLVDLSSALFGMPTSLLPALALDVFRVGPVGFGLLGAAPAVGALAAVFVSGWLSSTVHAGRALIVAVAIWGVAITAFGLLTFSFPLAWLALAIAGGADVISSVLRTTIIQFETPDDIRGRVTSIYSMTSQAGSRLGDVEAALVAAVAGTQFSVVSGGIACLGALAILVRTMPELGRHVIRRVPDDGASQPAAP